MTHSSPRLQHVLGTVALVCALAVSTVVPAQAAVSSAPLSASTSTPVSSTTAEPVTVSVQGNTVLGQTLSARAEAPSGSTYQWLRDGAAISGATSTSYRLVHADVCKRMSMRVTPPANSGADTTTSAETERVGYPVSAVVAPTVYGTATVGKTLTARTGTWPSGTKLSYQWQRNGSNIAKATSSSYNLTAADLGKKVTVRVTGSIAGCFTHQVSSAAAGSTTVKGAALAAATPAIIGTAAVGKTLTARVGSWTSGTSFSYQWLRNGKPIAKATNRTYKATAKDHNSSLSVKVTGKKSGYTTVSKTSSKTKKTAGAKLATSTPTIVGTAMVGRTLNARVGSWTSGTSFSYQWLRNGKPITKATKRTYTLTANDRGKALSLKVTGKKTGYTTTAKTSAKTKKAAAGTLSGATPRITGTTTVGKTLTVTRGTWTKSTTLSQQWLRNGKPIAKATGTKYKLTSADAGKRISVRVAGKKGGYTTLTKTSARTAAVKAAPKPKAAAKKKATTSSRITASGKSCPASHPIKGNRPTDGTDWKYHVPSGAFYSRTTPEECFKTTSAAAAAGYRASKR
ncbi:hypothetical protein [Citricoccus muralis]|uniref:Ig-like domain-containing protein n=1 Tax=Citricoccus muralis TaxID=169134 RepID=A0ABY8H8I4_9MICC|nr:hypothetical protein [Citricoccus muralis]WFP16922.1 hypothetical protein P8192_02010 [Citricoccus muralis]